MKNYIIYVYLYHTKKFLSAELTVLKHYRVNPWWTDSVKVNTLVSVWQCLCCRGKKGVCHRHSRRPALQRRPRGSRALSLSVEDSGWRSQITSAPSNSSRRNQLHSQNKTLSTHTHTEHLPSGVWYKSVKVCVFVVGPSSPCVWLLWPPAS